MPAHLTVVIPVYNGMPFLQEAVESILSQTYSEFRLLIINDGSTDNSSKYLNSLSDSRIEVLQQDNVGLCRSLNKAVFEHTESEFVARLDQDDISLPSRLEEQVNFMVQNPSYACVLSNISRIGSDGREFGYYETAAKEIIEDYDLQRYGCIVHSTLLFRREKFIEVGGYRQELYPVDDFDLLLRFW
jgi:glycosyltransferase involved in cell wall biosynthesis